jgi:hypothetical protein
MIRNRFLAVAAVLGLLGGLAVLASPGSAGPVDVSLNFIKGTYPQVSPVGTGLTDIFLTEGSATSSEVTAFGFGVSDLQLTALGGGIRAGKGVQVTNPATGQATLTLWHRLRGWAGSLVAESVPGVTLPTEEQLAMSLRRCKSCCHRWLQRFLRVTWPHCHGGPGASSVASCP